MASILQVEQIQGPTSGANANTIEIASGQTLNVNGTLTGDGSSLTGITTGKVLQVQYLHASSSYDDTSITTTTDVIIFNDTFTTVGDNSSLAIFMNSGQTLKTGELINTNFNILVDGVQTNNQPFEQHNFYGNTGTSEFRHYLQHNAFVENVGAAGSKNIIVYGNGYFGQTGTITFNFQGWADAPRRRVQMMIMEIAG